MISYDDIVKALPTLSGGDLDQLKKRISVMQSLGGAGQRGAEVTRETDSGALMVMEAIAEVLSRLGVEFVTPYAMQKTGTYSAFKAKVPDIFRYFERAKITRVQQRALLAVGVELLYNDMVDIGIATSSRLIMSHIHRIPSVINKSFPGYAENGMLGLILKKGK